MMRRTAILVIGLIAAVLATARALLKGRASQEQDEIDFAAVATRRRIRMRAQPFQGATILAAGASVELDLRRVLPAPTGVEISMLLFGSSLRVVIPPKWKVSTSVKTRAVAVTGPTDETSDDAPVLRLEGSAWLSRIEVIQRSAPVAVAS